MTEAILLCGVVWGGLLYNLYRSYRRNHRLDRYTLLTWMVFVGLASVFIFRIPAIQPAIDTLFDGQPITFTLSLLAVLMTTTAYLVTLKYVVTHSGVSYPLHRYHTWLIYAGPGMMLTVLLLMVFHLLGWLSAFRTEYGMKWFVEGYGLLQSSLVFVPISWRMYREEHVFPMRVKHLMILILTATFGISAAFSTVCIPPILLTGHENPGPYLIPRGVISAVCVAIFLIPHRWLVLLTLPHRLYLYVRLSSLENQLLELVVLRRKRLPWRHMLRLDKVDMAIYIIMINILDHYRRADLRDPLGCELYAKIQVLLAQEVGYEEFVEALCHVTL